MAIDVHKPKNYRRAWRGGIDLSRQITVCDACRCASCWQAKFFCDNAQMAGTVDLPLATLMQERRENEEYWFTNPAEGVVEGACMTKDRMPINIGHGWVYPRPDGVKARCGGPALCSACARDLAHKNTSESGGRDQFVQEITWHRLAVKLPPKRGRYRIRNGHGYESIGHYFTETEKEDAGWVTMDFDGGIEYWAELNS